MILANQVLRRDRLWREMLSIDQEQGEFVFGLSASSDSMSGRKNGLVLDHAYSILKATEIEDESGKKTRLVKIRYVLSPDLKVLMPRQFANKQLGIPGASDRLQASASGTAPGRTDQRNGRHT